MSDEAHSEALRRAVEQALRCALDPSDLLPGLHRLARSAAPDSEEGLFAHRQLAELLVERSPWRASVYARRVLAHRSGDDRAWAVLALAQTLLGHYRFAVHAYQQALSCAPRNPWYAHNLGHLLDVALDRPAEAVPWLKAAHGSAPRNTDVAASFAHALARTGRVDQARRVVRRAEKRGPSSELTALARWLERGAPGSHARRAPDGIPLPAGGRRTRHVKPTLPALERALARGLLNLPLDAEQRARALSLARDALRRTDGGPTQDVATQSLAAAIAYAVVFIDHVPLTQAEVAAPFRVGVASMRGRFAQLRARVDLTRLRRAP
jgi:tetratricopeptide (TPR) repeat protein